METATERLRRKWSNRLRCLKVQMEYLREQGQLEEAMRLEAEFGATHQCLADLEREEEPLELQPCNWMAFAASIRENRK